MRNPPFEKIQKIRKQIDQALSGGATPIAAFDADGTLWDTDLGESFFQYQIRNKLIPDLPESPWDYYQKMHHDEPEKGFLWLAQINKGFPLATVREWAKASVQESIPLPIFSPVKDLIQYLHERNVAVYVVTASVKWSDEPGAALFGIPADRVLGVKTAIENGIVTDIQDGAVTWREGKVTGIKEALGRVSPFLSAGNTMGDLALLDCATHLRWVNVAAPSDHTNHATERKLLEIARKRGWNYHDYTE